jgi:hypothetical protein
LSGNAERRIVPGLPLVINNRYFLSWLMVYRLDLVTDYHNDPGTSGYSDLREENMSFVVRAKEVVDKETGKTYRHYQLVEDRWEDGCSRQKIVAHLGEHPTVEDATTELRKRLRELEAVRDDHREAAGWYASAITRSYPAQLRKYHGGRIPTRSEHHKLSWPKPWATEKGRRYMRDFDRVEWKRSFLQKGQTYEAYSGYETFGSWVQAYWRHEKKATELQARADKVSAKLSKFERLSGVGSAGN